MERKKSQRPRLGENKQFSAEKVVATRGRNASIGHKMGGGIVDARKVAGAPQGPNVGRGFEYPSFGLDSKEPGGSGKRTANGDGSKKASHFHRKNERQPFQNAVRRGKLGKDTG